MIELNLLPDVKKEFIRAQKARNRVTFFSIVAVIGAVGVTIAMAAFVYGVQNAQMYFLSQDISSKSKELQNIPDIDKYLTVQNQLEKLSELHNSKNMYSRLLSFVKILNPNAPHEIQLGALEVNDETTTVKFSGTTDNFESFNIFKDTLENAKLTFRDASSADSQSQSEPLFSSVVVENSGLSRIGDSQKVSFVVSAVYNEKTFLNQYTDVVITVPNIETTGSAQGAPKPLFSNDAVPNQEGNE